ncbi:MAG: AMP-binding protein [Gammaproteobacteria bacterium]|jgi:O-succinylbenzoic acid--CoA ligase|nr:AMP-binding protein [Gammaproteobacteria bacterium]
MTPFLETSADLPAGWLERAVAAQADADALLAPGGEILSFAALLRRARGLAAALARAGVATGDAIGVCGLPALETALLLQAAARLGCAVVPVDPRRPGQWRTAVWLESGVGRAFSNAGELADLGGDASVTDDGIRATPEGVHLIVATSSSGGEPRGAMIAGRNLAASVHACRERLGLQAHDRWLVCLPLHHLGGLAILYRCVQAGACAVLHDGFDARRVWQDLAAHRVTHVSLVPAMLARLLDAAAGGPPPPTLRRVVLGGAELSPELLERARAAGWPICPAYSCTETCSQIAAALPEEQSPPGCVGRPLDTFDVQVVDAHGHPTWDVGRIKVSGEAVMAGYASPDRRPGLGLEDGWFTTGDLGRLDSGGRLWVTGRADDILVTGGENVHPRQVEEVLRVCPEVGEVAVTGRPDPVWGATLVAVYTGSIGEERLRAWCREHLHGAMRPRAFVRVDELPRLGHGKVDRQRLRGLAAPA